MIATTSLPVAVVGVVYCTRFQACGGTGAYDWSIAAGVLPQGIGMAPGTSEIYGRPLLAERAEFTVRVESGAESDEHTYVLTVIH